VRGSYLQALQAANQWSRLGGDVRHRHQAIKLGEVEWVQGFGVHPQPHLSEDDGGRHEGEGRQGPPCVGPAARVPALSISGLDSGKPMFLSASGNMNMNTIALVLLVGPNYVEALGQPDQSL
jgi:hypothetical protein